MSNMFKNGSKWLRFDCHLHTKSDTQFIYNEEENSYINSYINKLKETNISIGVITNHNKFNHDEFKAIRKRASKEDIFILPGVELSVNDGANGIHTLVVFNPDEWLENGNNYIEQFISETFASKHNYENEDGRSNDGLIVTIEKLNKYQRDYFIILAHVDDRSGFFEAFKGGRITELGKNRLFRDRVMGFQKVRTRDNIEKCKQWLDYELPAFVEGSDPKKIEDIGKGKKSYIKIGDYNFEAVKFALQNKQLRVKKEKPEIENSYIKSISFDGGKLNGKTIELSSSMNNFVGIRGSGKSSIIEAIRYGLDLEFSDKNADYKYKNNLIEKLLGSAGKITIKAVDRHDNEYTIKRVYGHSVEIKKDDEIKNLDIFSLLNKPLYFGQKDLSNYQDGYENDLIDKFIGDKTKNVKAKIETKKQEIKIQLENIKKYDNDDSKKEEIEKKIEELKLKIAEYKKHKIEEKLKKQMEFNKDESNFSNIIKDLKEFRDDADRFLKSYEGSSFFDSLKQYISKENQDLFDELYAIIDASKSSFLSISEQLNALTNSFEKISALYTDFKGKYKQFNDEFLEIQRNIELPDNLRADDFIKYTKTLNSQELMLKEIEKRSSIKKGLQENLDKLISELNNLYLDEFKIIKNEISLINKSKSSIRLEASFKGNRESFERYLRNIFSGSGLARADYEKLKGYKDCIEIYHDFNNISFGGNKQSVFQNRFKSSLSSLLTFQVPNQIEIFYNNQLLLHHSLGQRASALIIFILTQRDNDIIIIDQPEDDLDNQTIYKEVIKELVELKSKTQFIFATHNANIPVLGDCEQIIVCNYEDDEIETQAGSIDTHSVQNNIINIMEGGEEAFDKRRDIYNLWKH